MTTNSETYKQKLQSFRSHGITRDTMRFRNAPHGAWYYEMQELGNNYRITDFQCSLGRTQLKRLERFISLRAEIANAYEREFDGNPWFDLPAMRDYGRTNLHLYPVRMKEGVKKKRPIIFDQLRERGVGVQVHYIPVYFHPYYRDIGYMGGSCPQAEDFYWRELSLPIYQGMTDEGVRTVVESVREVFSKAV